MTIKRTLAVAAVFVCLLAGPAAALSYEFHLLGGMVVKGNLKDFRGGVFYVETELGEMTINAANLDYIIVEPEDEAGPRGVPEGALEFGLPPGKDKDWEPERVEVPQDLEGYSVPEAEKGYPGSFSGVNEEAPPALAGHSTLGGGQGPRGTFTGKRIEAAPSPLEGYSMQEEELPSGLRITADDYAGVVLDMEGAGMPEPFGGHSVIGDEEASESYPGRFMPEAGEVGGEDE